MEGRQRRRERRRHQSRVEITEHYRSPDRFYPEAAFLFSFFFYIMYFSHFCNLLSLHSTCLASLWPSQLLDATHCLLFRLFVGLYKVCILPALLVCTPAGNGTELIFFLLHLWPSFRPFLVFLAICLTSRVACILTRQSGSPSFRTTSEVPTQSRPDTPSKIPLRGCSKPRTKPGVVPKIHHYILAWVSLPYLAS